MKTSSMSILDILNTDADESTTRMSLDTDRITLVERELDVDTVQDVDMEIDLDDHTSQPYTTDSNEQYQESDQQPASDDIIAAKVLESLDGSSKPGVKNDKFLKRVYSIPFLNNTVNSINNCYESTKNISGVLKYSAESVESVTMRVTLPVLNTLEPVLTPLDRFACNQLDRVEKRFPFISGYTHPPSDQPLPSNDSIYKMESGDAGNVENGQVQEKTQSRWPKVVGSVGANLGVLKKETVAALRYCIEIIQYATSAIAGQINTLRQAIKFDSGDVVTVVGNIRKEIALILRNVVDTIAKYSTLYLPTDAKQTIKQFILNLPSKISMSTKKDEEVESCMMLATESKLMLEGIQGVVEGVAGSAEYTLGIERKDNVL